MKRSLRYSEKVIGGFQIIWGVFSIFISFYGMKNLYDVGVRYSHLTFEKILIWKFIKHYHFDFLLAILSSTFGLLLILNKKSGWQFTIITSFVSAMTGAINLIHFFYEPGKHTFSNTTMLFVGGTLITISLLIFLILLLKPFRIKYAPTKRTWWTIIIVSGLLLLDNIILVVMK